jgi:hypothetical protein
LIITVAILPQFHADVALDGKDSAVILLDTEGRFSISRLVEIMQGYITTKDPEAVKTSELINKSLQHLHIFQPQTMESTLATLSSLHSYISKQAQASAQRPLHSIIVDSASTFYWQSRADADTVQLSLLEQNATGLSPALPNPYNLLVQSLRELSRTFSCAIVATTYAFSFTTKEAGMPVLRTLPAPWTTFPTVKLLLTREPVRKFARGMSVEEALKEQAGRQQVVERARFRAILVGSSDVLFFVVQKNGVVVEGDK